MGYEHYELPEPLMSGGVLREVLCDDRISDHQQFSFEMIVNED
jgi:hypothetical protein